MDISNAFCCAWNSVTRSVVRRLLQYVLLCMDDRSATHLARIIVFYEENKYIEGDCTFLREKIQDGAIITYHIKSVQQLTDSLSEAFCNSFCVFVRDEFDTVGIHKLNV